MLKPKPFKYNPRDVVLEEFDGPDIYWDVKMDDKDSWFACQNQIDAEILGRLVRIEHMLKKMNKQKVD